VAVGVANPLDLVLMPPSVCCTFLENLLNFVVSLVWTGVECSWGCRVEWLDPLNVDGEPIPAVWLLENLQSAHSMTWLPASHVLDQWGVDSTQSCCSLLMLGKMSFLASSCAMHSSCTHSSIGINSVATPSLLGGALPSIAL